MNEQATSRKENDIITFIYRLINNLNCSENFEKEI